MSLRNYISASEIATIVAVQESDIDSKTLAQAEELVDNAIANFYTGPFAPAYQGSYVGSGVFTDSSVTVSTPITQNSLTFTAIQILSGPKAGSTAFVSGNSSNTINFSTISGLTGTETFRVYQPGKAPFISDKFNGYKTINQAVKRAVAYQVEAMLANADTPESVKSKKSMKSESIGQSYSYTADDKANANKSPLELLAPQSAQILIDAGLAYQSI